MEDSVSLEGPVELYEGQLALRIPLAAGGDRLAPYARGVGQVDGEYLAVVIQPWLAGMLRIGEGSVVCVDNRGGQLNVTRSAANDALEQGPERL